MRRTLLAAALIALAGAAAPGCKGSLLKDISEYPKTKAELEIEALQCLGVAVPKKSPPLALGVKIERVLRESPADKAGLRSGDEIRSLAWRAGGGPGSGTSVRTPKDLEDALRLCQDGQEIDIGVAREGEERKLKARLVTWGRQKRYIGEHFASHAKTYESTLAIPFLFDYQRLEVSPEMVREYAGVELKEPLLLYRDIDIIPLVGIFSLFRLETSDYRDAWRFQVLTWPLKFTSISEVSVRLTFLQASEEDLEWL